jgi:zinc transporter ZupT
MQQPYIIAGISFVAVLIAGAIPIMVRVEEESRLLRRMTGLAAGSLIVSALTLGIPEGVEMSGGYLGIAILMGFLMMILECFGFGHDIHEEHHAH